MITAKQVRSIQRNHEALKPAMEWLSRAIETSAKKGTGTVFMLTNKDVATSSFPNAIMKDLNSDISLIVSTLETNGFKVQRNTTASILLRIDWRS